MPGQEIAAGEMRDPSTALPPMLILCGGFGSRLRSVVSDRPKPMVPIDGKPFLEHLIDYYRNQGIRKFVLCAGFMGEMIRDHFAGWEGVDVRIESSPLGTAGSVALGAQELNDSHFFVTNGDSFCAVEASELYRITLEKRALATLAIARVEKSGDYGSLCFDVEGRLQSFREKVTDAEAFCWVNAGVYCFSSEIIDLLPKSGSLERDVFPSFLEDGRVYILPSKSRLLDIGTPERLAGASEQLRAMMTATTDGQEPCLQYSLLCRN